jgi:parallel beta-helix repeat protein
MHEPTSTAFFATEEKLDMSRMNGAVLLVVSFALVLILSGVVPHIEPAKSNDYLPKVQPVDNPQPEKRSASSGTPHGPIVITSNANFAATALAENWPGNGSSSNPYIIDGLDIDRGGVAGHCISITGTGVYFTISNCSLTGANTASGAGIYLLQVTNARIANNILYNNFFGIHLDWGALSTVANNNCSANGEGIWLDDSDDNTVANNTCTNNGVGIHIADSASVITANNTCSNNTGIGIRLDWAAYTATVSNNTCNGNSHGIYIDSDTYGDHTVLWNAFANNSIANAADYDGSTVFDYNYWSDYAGVDVNRDCIGDTSHGFPGGTDPHPLILPPNRPMMAWDESVISNRSDGDW